MSTSGLRSFAAAGIIAAMLVVTGCASMMVSPDLTEAQARAIAAESCRHNTVITGIQLDTAAEHFAEQRVSAWEFASDECIDAEHIAIFARTVEAVQTLPEFVGEVNYGGPIDPLYGYEQERDGASEFRIDARETAGLLEALRAVREALPGLTLSVWGEIREPGTISESSLPTLDAFLSPDADVARVLPVLAAALELDVVNVKVDDNTVTLSPGTSDLLSSPELHQLERLGQQAGVEVTTQFLPLRNATNDSAADQATQSELIAAILAVPGGATIQSPAHGEPSIEVHDFASIEAVTQLLAVREQISMVDRVILTLANGSSELSVHLAGSATQADADSAKSALVPLAREVFDEVRLATPFSEMLGEPVV